MLLSRRKASPDGSMQGLPLRDPPRRSCGWSGGAIAAHLRVHDKFVIQMIVPIVIWIGFGLRHVDQMRVAPPKKGEKVHECSRT